MIDKYSHWLQIHGVVEMMQDFVTSQWWLGNYPTDYLRYQLILSGRGRYLNYNDDHASCDH